MEEKINITKIKEVLNLTFKRQYDDDMFSYEQHIIKIPVSVLIIPVNNKEYKDYEYNPLKEYKGYEYDSLTEDNKNIILCKYKYIRLKESESYDILTGEKIDGRDD